MKYDIWIEGHKATGSESHAHPLAFKVEGESFIAAVEKWYNTLSEISDVVTMYGRLEINDGNAYLWGCRLYDNWKDASKSFG